MFRSAQLIPTPIQTPKMQYHTQNKEKLRVHFGGVNFDRTECLDPYTERTINEGSKI